MNKIAYQGGPRDGGHADTPHRKHPPIPIHNPDTTIEGTYHYNPKTNTYQWHQNRAQE